MKVVEENNEKIFTKNYGKDIIIISNIPLNKNLFKKDGLIMYKTKEGILDKKRKLIIKKNEKKDKFIRLLKKICKDFKIDDYEKEIKNFLNHD